MATKKVNYTKSGVNKLPDDKPVLYRIQTECGKDNYVGVAQRGRVRERIEEHIGEIPGSMVSIEQFESIDAARDKEAKVIKQEQPKYNEQGK